MDYLNRIFINVLPAVLILVIQISLGRPAFRSNKKTTPDMVIFTYFCISVFTILIIEASRWFLYAFPHNGNRTIHTLLFFLYYALQYAPASIYLLYVDYHIYERTDRIKTMMKVLVPINVIMVIISASAPWTGLLYRIDESNTYTRGSGTYIYFILLIILTLTGIIIVLKGRKKRNRKTIRNLLIFPFITLASGAAQILVYGFSIAWPSSVIFIVVAAMNVQKIQMHTDHLTGLFNRRSFDDRLTTEIQRTERYGSPLTIILMDIDHFKDINDEYGHHVGDDVLVQISEILTANTRTTDTVARWGGEEFIILMPETEQSEAAYSADKLRKKIEEFDFVNGIKVTMSFGVAQWLKIISKNMWFKLADKALYQAKEKGRNRVEQCLWRTILAPEETSIRWQSRYETGHKDVDEEHQDLIQIATRLLADSDSDEALQKAKLELKNHIAEHFDHEESLMEAAGYPQKSQHTEIHHKLVEDALATFEEVDRGFYDNFYFFLIDEVIIKHFFRQDKPLVEFLQEQKT